MAILKRFVPEPEVKDWRGSDGVHYEAKCEQCGRIFYPKRSTAKYCSRRCNDEYNKGNWLEKEEPEEKHTPAVKETEKGKLSKAELAARLKRAREIAEKYRE